MSLFWLHFYVNKLDSALSSKFTLALMRRYEHKMDSDDIVDRLRYVAGYFDIAGDVRIEKGTRLCVSIDRPLESRANLMRIKEMFGGLVSASDKGSLCMEGVRRRRQTLHSLCQAPHLDQEAAARGSRRRLGIPDGAAGVCGWNIRQPMGVGLYSYVMKAGRLALFYGSL